MGRNISSSACVFIIIAVVLASANEGPYEFAKLIIQWVPSKCNQVGYDCAMPILDRDRFVVESLRPMYFNDTTVLPYAYNRECNPEFGSEAEAFPGLTPPLQSEMNKHWPYLMEHDDPFTQDEINELTWITVYRIYGVCYVGNYPPSHYFETAMNLMRLYGIGMVETLHREGKIDPKYFQTYHASQFSMALKDFLGHWPQIRCNRDANRHLQIFEIGICIDRELRLIDCKVEYVECDKLDLIKFPPAL